VVTHREFVRNLARALRLSELNRHPRIDGEQSINLVKEQTMIVRAGFEIAFELPQPTPMILMLSVHPSRAKDILTIQESWRHRACRCTIIVIRLAINAPGHGARRSRRILELL
jgi:hypothetical protein